MSNLVFDESSSNREASHGYAWWFSGDTFEKAMAEDRKPRKRSLMHRLTALPGRLTIIYFLLLVAISTSLLLTPISTPRGRYHRLHHRIFHRRFRNLPPAASPSSTPLRIGPPSARRC